MRKHLDSSSDDDTHEEVWNNTSYSHHQALHNGDTCVEAENKEKIVSESWMQPHHEVTYCPGDESYDDQERCCS